MTKILLITHQTSKTGAPYTILLVFKEIIKRLKNLQLDVLALSSEGPLKDSFNELANTFFYPEKYYGYKKTYYEKIANFLNLKNYTSPWNIIVEEIAKEKYDIIYANTVASIPSAIKLKNSNTKLVVHIHELNHAIEECLPDLIKYAPAIDIVLVPSLTNKELLIQKFQLNENKIVVCREAALAPNLQLPKEDKKDTFNVYMCGTANWRKGEDLFLQLANETLKEDNNIHFHWIGHQTLELKKRTETELQKLTTKSNIHFSGETSDIYQSISQMDCFVLTSREDPFPLAAIEAGMAGLPIICFDQGNGIQEVLRDQDYVVEYLNIVKMKEKILYLKNTPSERTRVGFNNKKTFLEYTPDKISTLIIDVLEKLR